MVQSTRHFLSFEGEIYENFSSKAVLFHRRSHHHHPLLTSKRKIIIGIGREMKKNMREKRAESNHRQISVTVMGLPRDFPNV